MAIELRQSLDEYLLVLGLEKMLKVKSITPYAGRGHQATMACKECGESINGGNGAKKVGLRMWHRGSLLSLTFLVPKTSGHNLLRFVPQAIDNGLAHLKKKHPTVYCDTDEG